MADSITNQKINPDSMVAQYLSDQLYKGLGASKAYYDSLADFERQAIFQQDAQEYGREMTAYQNEWNSQQAQAARMKAAGSSPAAVAQAVAGNPVTTSAASASGISSAPDTSRYMTAAAESYKDYVAAELLKSQKEAQDIQNSWSPKINEETVNSLKAKAKKDEEDGKLTSEEYRQKVLLFDTVMDIKETELDNLKSALETAVKQRQALDAQISRDHAAAEVARKQVNLIGQEIETEKEETRKRRSEADSAESQAIVDNLRASIAAAGLNPDSKGWSAVLQSIVTGNLHTAEIAENVLVELKSSYKPAGKAVGHGIVKGLTGNPLTASTGLLLEYLLGD